MCVSPKIRPSSARPGTKLTLGNVGGFRERWAGVGAIPDRVLQFRANERVREALSDALIATSVSCRVLPLFVEGAAFRGGAADRAGRMSPRSRWAPPTIDGPARGAPSAGGRPPRRASGARTKANKVRTIFVRADGYGWSMEAAETREQSWLLTGGVIDWVEQRRELQRSSAPPPLRRFRGGPTMRSSRAPATNGPACGARERTRPRRLELALSEPRPSWATARQSAGLGRTWGCVQGERICRKVLRA